MYGSLPLNKYSKVGLTSVRWASLHVFRSLVWNSFLCFEGGFSQPPTPTPPPENSGLGLIPGAQSEGDSDKEVFFTPRQSVSSASSSSTSTPNIESCSPNKGQNQEQDYFTYIQPGSEEHEAMKESFIRIARGKLEEWEASALIDGLISKKPNEQLSHKSGTNPNQRGNGN